MKFDLPLLIQAPNIKDTIIHIIENWPGTFSAAKGKKRDRDTHIFTRGWRLTEFGKDSW